MFPVPFEDVQREPRRYLLLVEVVQPLSLSKRRKHLKMAWGFLGLGHRSVGKLRGEGEIAIQLHKVCVETGSLVGNQVPLFMHRLPQPCTSLPTSNLNVCAPTHSHTNTQPATIVVGLRLVLVAPPPSTTGTRGYAFESSERPT